MAVPVESITVRPRAGQVESLSLRLRALGSKAPNSTMHPLPPQDMPCQEVINPSVSCPCF